jgi:hypothetical protein
MPAFAICHEHIERAARSNDARSRMAPQAVG